MKQTGTYPEVLSRSVDLNDLRFCFKDREKRTNKGDFGRVLFVCGTYPDDNDGYAMSGAATLSARAALRCGSGLVEVCTHKGNFAPISANLPEAIMLIYDDKVNEDVLKASVNNASAIVVGCGLGKSENAKIALKTVLENAHCPLVIDADGLNILSEEPDLWSYLSNEQRARTVITPHMKEMSRLCGSPISDIIDSPHKVAWDFSQRHGVITLLKDHKTIITNGRVMYVNLTGNPGMSTAGAGDVLSGILGSTLGNPTLCCDSFVKKVAISAYLHGLAGDVAKEKYGEHSLVASDIAESIPEALLRTKI